MESLDSQKDVETFV